MNFLELAILTDVTGRSNTPAVYVLFSVLHVN